MFGCDSEIKSTRQLEFKPTLARVSASPALGYAEKPRLAVDLLHAVREACAGRPCFAC